MVYEERNIWSSLIVSVIGMIVYVIVMLQVAGGGPLDRGRLGADHAVDDRREHRRCDPREHHVGDLRGHARP